MVFGDFNVGDFMRNGRDPKSAILHNLVSLLNFTQFNCIANCDNRFLDLIFCTFNTCSVTRDSEPLLPEDRYHPALNISLTVKNLSYVNFPLCTSTKVYNFKRANFPMLYNDILNIDWNFLLVVNDVNRACDLFYAKLYSVFDKHIPLLKCKKFSFPCWYSKELRDLIRTKQKLHSQWKRNSTPELYYQFSNVRRREIFSFILRNLSNL